MKTDKGFIKIIIIIIIALFILSSFNIKVESIFKSSVFKDNISYLGSFITTAVKFVKVYFNVAPQEYFLFYKKTMSQKVYCAT